MGFKLSDALGVFGRLGKLSELVAQFEDAIEDGTLDGAEIVALATKLTEVVTGKTLAELKIKIEPAP